MATSKPFHLGVLASGGGTNFQAILDRTRSGEIPAAVSVIISNNSTSGALERARAAGIDALHMSAYTHPGPGQLDAAICDAMGERDVDLIVLAGYMKKLGPKTLARYRNRIINVHPSLLPAFGGQGMYGGHVHEAVIRSGARYSGVTVHLIDEDYDTGPIVAQEVVRVEPSDSPDDLAARVLEVEHALYPAVVRLFAEGRVSVQERQVLVSS